MNLHPIFTLSLNIFPQKLWMIQKTFGDDAMSAAPIKVCHKCFKDGQESIESDPHSGRPAEFFGKTSNHSGDSALLQPRLGALRLLAFPKTKITFERGEISDRQ